MLSIYVASLENLCHLCVPFKQHRHCVLMGLEIELPGLNLWAKEAKFIHWVLISVLSKGLDSSPVNTAVRAFFRPKQSRNSSKSRSETSLGLRD